MGRNARFARDIIRVAGEYGLFMSWQLLSENYAAIACSADNEALFDTVCEYGEYVIPMHEMNCEFSKYIDHLSALGLWLSGSTANWGVEAQSWYWADAGLNKPGTYEPGSLEMPGGMYSIMFMLGAVGGATAYSVEPSWDIWPGPNEWRFNEWIVPTFRRLVTERLIPDRSQVLEVTPVAYQLPRCERHSQFHAVSEDLDFDHNAGRLIRATYGVYDRARDPEIIPNNARYGWFPVLPTKTPEASLAQFRHIIKPGDLPTIAAAREHMEQFYPPVDRGTAWSHIVGPLIFAANTHENWFVPESVKLQVPRRSDGLRIERAGASSILRWRRNDGDRAYRVWRLRQNEEICITPEPLSVNEYVLPATEPGDEYAVSAFTSATETLEGTLHLHQFLILNRYESRRSAWVNLAGGSAENPRFFEEFQPESDDIRKAEEVSAACSAVEDIASPAQTSDDPDAASKRAVIDGLIGWKQSIEAEDLDAILGWYASDYREPDGRGIDWVNAAFRLVLRKYMMEQFQRVYSEWGAIPGWQYPAFRLLVRDWKSIQPDEVLVDVVAHMWAGGGPEMEPSDMFNHPFGRPHTMTMTWKRTDEGWRIACTDPAFLRIEDTAIFRFRYQGW
jgi:hypothetical protein